MKATLVLLVLALTASISEAEDVCIKSLGLVLDKETGECVSLCDESNGKIWNPKKGRCRRLCKKKQGLEFNKKKKECKSLCGRVRMFDKETKKCFCAGTNTNYKKKKDNCKCKKGFYEIKPDPDGNWRTLECTLAVPTASPNTPVPTTVGGLLEDIAIAPTLSPTASPSATPSIAPSGLIPVQTTQSVNFTTDGSFADMMSDEQANEIGDLLCDLAMEEDSDVLSCERTGIEVLPLADTGTRRRLSSDGRELQGFVVMRATVVVSLLIVFTSETLTDDGFTRSDVMNNNPDVARRLDMTDVLNEAATAPPFLTTLLTNDIVSPYFEVVEVFVIVAVTVLVITEISENSMEPSEAPSEAPITPTGSPLMSLAF